MPRGQGRTRGYGHFYPLAAFLIFAIACPKCRKRGTGMVRPKSAGPSERLLRWTQYLFLVAAGIVSLTVCNR